MRSPVILIIFNRPELTQRVFSQIAEARPNKLLVIADGPRAGRVDDVSKCATTRAIIEAVNWDCEVLTNYSEMNLGCAWRVATGLTWAFEQVEEAIILEDDCLPHPTFFRYCDELLERYRDDTRVMHISGSNVFADQKQINDSYVYSCYTLSWGWATWRRAFRYYDPKISLWPRVRESTWLTHLLGDPTATEHWRRIFDTTYKDIGAVNTWDFQWLFACWLQRGLAVLPNINLVTNIGYGEDATHTKDAGDVRANLAAVEMRFPLKNPQLMIRDREIEQIIFDRVARSQEHGKNFYSRFREKCAEALPVRARRALSHLKARMS